MDFDLAIVGGGPAGIATALFLAAAAPHRRRRIVVLEKERYPREKICAGAIGARADRLLATIGVRVDVPSAQVSGLAVSTGRAALAERAPSTIGRVVRRFEFDRAFADEARQRGLAIQEGARVTGLTFARSGVGVETSAGPLRARAVVGADGVGSFVRRVLGAPRGRWLAQVVEVDTPAAAGELTTDRELLRFDLSDRSLYGYAWDFPTIVAGDALVCRGVYVLRHDRSDPSGPDVDARLTARLERLGLSTNVKRKRFAERGLSLHEPMARARALLVGEAAGIDPALGEGIPQAIFYGATAARYLAEKLDRDDLAFVDWPRHLASSRVGLDLRARAAFTPFLYGPTRALAEEWITSSRHLASAGVHYFAGDHVPRGSLLQASLFLAALGARALLAR